MEKKKIIVVGAGRRFFRYQDDILRRYSVQMIADNSQEKRAWKSISGTPVGTFEDIESYEYEIALVTMLTNISEIICQLIKTGVPKEKIKIWYPLGYTEESRYSLEIVDDGSVYGRVSKVWGDADVKFKLCSNSDFSIFEEIYLKNAYRISVPAKSILFDIGLNIGMASIYFASNHNIERVYGFEPFVPTYERAIENVNMNSNEIQNKIQTYNYGLSNFEGEKTFQYREDSPGGMRIGFGSSPIERDQKNAETIRIREAGKEIVRLIHNETDKCFIMKMDIEGSEYDCFENMEKYGLFEKLRIIVMETHDGRADELVDMLERHGFNVYSPYEGGSTMIGMLYASR